MSERYPIFRNDLSPEEQKKQDALEKKLVEEKAAMQGKKCIADAVATMIEIILDLL